MNIIKEKLDNIESVSSERIEYFRQYWDGLVHPTGSLGDLEEIGIKLSAIYGEVPQSLEKKVTLVMCADNGIIEENISSSPKILTQLLALEMVDGVTGVNALSKAAKADVKVVDLGIENFEGHTFIIDRRISNGTKNLMQEDAMSYDQALESIQIGIDLGEEMIKKGYSVLGTGELGMGNTTTSALMIKSLTQAPTDQVLGLGSGVDAQQLANKRKVVDQAMFIRQPDTEDPIDILAKLGGYDIGAIAGVFIAGAAHRIPVVIDGIISAAGALLAYSLQAHCKDYMFPSHIAKENGNKVAIEAMGLKGYLDLGMRLGEGSGCPLFFQVMDASLACMNQMSKFEDTTIQNTLVNIRDQD